MEHTFKQSQAKSFEDVIDDYLKSKGYQFTEATRDEQRKGIDRILSDGTKIEFKSESKLSQTGNFFIETISVDKEDKPPKLGWVYYSESKYILYYFPLEKENQYLWVLLEDLKRLVPEWQVKYKSREVRNPGYKTHGILVPRAEIEKLAQNRP